MTLRVRAFSAADLDATAAVHAEAFERQRNSSEWIACNARAHPRMRLYVAVVDGAVRGYILWTEKSGFRSDVVVELEQLAVAARYRRQGIGEALIAQSLPAVAAELAARSAKLKAVLVSTRADNAAQRLYRKVLGAEVEATLPSFYSGDEVLMVARKPPLARE
jgi:ribosomal protein S18 acetylase RimI-like enzyme